jgi:hypothetical protein
MYYYSTPNYSVALNAKVGSSSFARAIIKQFHASAERLITTAAYPAGKDETKRAWHWMCPGSTVPDKPVVLLVRSPVDRFITAMQQIGLGSDDVPQAIASLSSDTPIVRTYSSPEHAALEQRRRDRISEIRESRVAQGLPVQPPVRADHLRDDVHFAHQHLLASGSTTCFRFPDHVDQAAAFIGLTETLPARNQARREKPTLTAEQEAEVRAYYATDQSLYDAIDQPGYVYTPPEWSPEA